MKLLHSILLLLLLSSCATHHPQTYSQGIQDTARQDDRNFFYGGWWLPKSTPQDVEDRNYFYGGFVGKQ